MGTGASKGPTVAGAPVNPRVQYSKKLEKKENKKNVVDAPVLVDVEHGSIRYRQPNTNKIETTGLKGKEHPYENEKGKELANKENYFYHGRLKEYGQEASKEKEDAFKFYYVLKGPASARQQKVFYVYGQGWNSKDGLKVKPTETVTDGNDFAWSSTRKPNSLYYLLNFDDNEVILDSEEDKLLSDLQSSPDKSNIKLSVSAEERTQAIKARLAIKLLKSVKDIHIAYDNRELRDEDVISDLRPKTEEEETGEEKELPGNFSVVFTLI